MSTPIGSGPPPSLGPLRDPSLEAEEKAMRKGKLGLIIGSLLFVIGLFALAIFLLLPDGKEIYETYGKNVNTLDREQFDAFWPCALPGSIIRDIRSDEEMSGRLLTIIQQGRGRWVAKVKTECVPKLTAESEGLDALIPPEDMLPLNSQLRDAVDTLKGRVSDLTTYVESNSEGALDDEEVLNRTRPVAAAWIAYKRAFKAVNDSLREKLDA